MARKFSTAQILQEDIADDLVPLMERIWYYSIEVEPDVWTRGRKLKNVYLTREALRRCTIGAGMSALDIGSMEGLVSILLERRGLDVVTYDRLNWADRFAFLRQKLGVRIPAFQGLPLSDLPSKLPGKTFDLVVFSGVLYHMFDILDGLLAARRFVRNGGIIVVETACVISPEMSAQFNAGSRFYTGDNFWFPSTALFDYLLRFCRLKPLDAFYLRQKAVGDATADLARVCVPCLAVDHAPAADGDTWINSAQTRDFAEHLDWAMLAASARDPIPYDQSGRSIVRMPNGLVDVHATITSTPETLPLSIRDDVGLPLSAIY